MMNNLEVLRLTTDDAEDFSEWSGAFVADSSPARKSNPGDDVVGELSSHDSFNIIHLCTHTTHKLTQQTHYIHTEKVRQQ